PLADSPWSEACTDGLPGEGRRDDAGPLRNGRACLLLRAGASLDALYQAFLEVVPEYLVLVLMINSYGARQRMPRRESSPVPGFVKAPYSDIEAIYVRTQELRQSWLVV